MQGERLKRVEKLKYLGSTMTDNCILDEKITHRVQAGWKNWRKVSGVLCDRRISVKIKGRVYKMVVRPAMMYGAETWPLKKRQEKKLEAGEMKMLRWMCGMTRMDKIRNEKIRRTTKVMKIRGKYRREECSGLVM